MRGRGCAAGVSGTRNFNGLSYSTPLKRADRDDPRPAEIIEVLKTGLARMRFNCVDPVGHAVLDVEARFRTPHVGAHSARGEDQKRPLVVAVAGGEAPHEHVQRRLAAAIYLVAAILIVRDAALT